MPLACAARAFLRRLKDEDEVAEAVLLSTCNRTELYAVVENEGARERLLDAMAEEKGVDRDALERYTYWLTDDEAARHLYRVASGLESQVLGDVQVLGPRSWARSARRTGRQRRNCAPAPF